jgi:hypothetical protein
MHSLFSKLKNNFEQKRPTPVAKTSSNAQAETSRNSLKHKQTVIPIPSAGIVAPPTDTQVKARKPSASGSIASQSKPSSQEKPKEKNAAERPTSLSLLIKTEPNEAGGDTEPPMFDPEPARDESEYASHTVVSGPAPFCSP